MRETDNLAEHELDENCHCCASYFERPPKWKNYASTSIFCYRAVPRIHLDHDLDLHRTAAWLNHSYSYPFESTRPPSIEESARADSLPYAARRKPHACVVHRKESSAS